jgi:Cu(I)/Ag(I) efflux system membrane protein CusA/SilA
MIFGLVPVLWSTGTGADVMKRIAAPMVGGLVTSFLLELTVYPAIFAIWKGRGLLRKSVAPPPPTSLPAEAHTQSSSP